MDGLDRVYEAEQRLEVLVNLMLAADREKLDDITGFGMYLMLRPIQEDLLTGLRELNYKEP
jgi:hypothetical protein